MAEQVAKIGFIGLGRMGDPMTRNLLRAGFSLRVYDVLPERVAALVAVGAQAANSPAEAAQDADLVISMILDDAVLKAVALGPDGVLSVAAPGTIYADMSTVSPMASRAVTARAEETGVAYLRAKVSGSVKPATEGRLTIFASGPREAYDRCGGVFRTLGKASYYIGMGEEAIYLKLVHSIMVGVYSAMVGEAFAFGERGGTDWGQMIDVIDNSAVGSVLFNYKAPLLRERDYVHPQSTVDVAAKDIDLALAAAKELNLPMPVTALVRELFRSMQARGEGDQDFIGIVKLFESMAGVTVDGGQWGRE
ncbi:MAG TPA: NAD(P)-dependent oxidoreductase [Anaerolineae bacterium]